MRLVELLGLALGALAVIGMLVGMIFLHQGAVGAPDGDILGVREDAQNPVVVGKLSHCSVLKWRRPLQPIQRAV